MEEAAGVRIEEVRAAVVRPLRQKVLRPHQMLADQVYPGDSPPGRHFAAYGEGEAVLGVASISPERYPRAGASPGPGDRRIRGMATEPAARGRGIGALLLAACLEVARADERATRVWCNARSGVRGFYEREGFVVDGEEFALPEIGPHFLMWLAV